MGRHVQTLPMFPLGTVSLFPHVRAPFHIFEPRYRQMTDDVLSGDGRLVMATVRPEGSDRMAGDPPVFPVGCAAVVRDSHRLPDGRFHLMLLGTHRVRILEEPPRPGGRLYRVAEVEALDDGCDSTDEERLATLRSRTLTLVHALLADRDEAGRDPEQSLASFRGVDDAAFVNALCSSLPLPTLEKQGLLEADGIPARFERLIEFLSFAVACGEGRRTPNSGRFH